MPIYSVINHKQTNKQKQLKIHLEVVRGVKLQKEREIFATIHDECDS